MHLGNGAVTPACAALAMTAAGIGVGIAAVLAKKTGAPEPKKFALVSALVFAAQTFNLPIVPQASGHVLGGFLLAYLFGGGWGTIGMTLILTLQSLLFGDGGLATLGCNVLNMAILPCLLVYPMWLRFVRSSGIHAVAAGAFVSVLVSALACAVEVLSQPQVGSNAMRIVGLMVGLHAIAGVMEAIFTVLVIQLLQRPSALRLGTVAVAGLVIAAWLGASPWPDGLEFTLARFSLYGGHAAGLLTDYTLASTFLAAAILATTASALSILMRKRVHHARSY